MAEFPNHLASGASGFAWGSLPLHADALTPAPWRSPRPAADFVLGTPGDGRRPRYPGDRPPGSFVVHEGQVLTVRPSSTRCGWQVLGRDPDPTDLDEWLVARGQAPIATRVACVGYGSNLNPAQVHRFAGPTAAVVLRAVTVGTAAAYCTSPRQTDSQYPAGIVADSPSRVEAHGIVLLHPDRTPHLDRKEGQGGTYARSLVAGRGAPVAAVLEDGTMLADRLPVYLQRSRRVAMSDGRAVLLADRDQEAFARDRPADETDEHGLVTRAVDRLPPLETVPVPVFAYGTLRPGRSRWPAIAGMVASHEPASLHGDRFETGYGYPGLRLGRAGAPVVAGVLLQPAPGQHRRLVRELDLIEGHPGLYARHLVRLDDGRLAWTYVWGVRSGT